VVREWQAHDKRKQKTTETRYVTVEKPNELDTLKLIWVERCYIRSFKHAIALGEASFTILALF
jgi:hypothetical protein